MAGLNTLGRFFALSLATHAVLLMLFYPLRPALREPIPEQSVVAERQLPTLKELLPSATWSSSNPHDSAPVSLNTKDPIYVTYFNKLKQLIESHWEYPELALRYGLQGRLSLE